MVLMSNEQGSKVFINNSVLALMQYKGKKKPSGNHSHATHWKTHEGLTTLMKFPFQRMVTLDDRSTHCRAIAEYSPSEYNPQQIKTLFRGQHM